MRSMRIPLLLGAVLLAGCTTADVGVEAHPAGASRPDLILVYDFAYAPGMVRLDRGVIPEIVEAAKAASPSAQELQVGRQVADVVAERVVAKLRAAGLPAQRALGHALPLGNTLSVEGQFVSIDAGNQTERIVLGFGAGRSQVDTRVQVYMDTRHGERLVESLDVEAKSALMPGLVPAAVGGNVAGHLLAAVAVNSGIHAASELGGGVDAEGRRLADAVAGKLEAWFREQGWLPAEAG